MNPPKILVLEYDWRKDASPPPVGHRSSGWLYAGVSGIRNTTIIHRPLRLDSYIVEIRDFVKAGQNRRGPNLIILSAHAYHESGKKGVLAADDGLLELNQAFTGLRNDLRRTIFILDACHLGKDLENFCANSGALGAVGFEQVVNWTASSVFVLSFLRRLCFQGVWDMRRAVSSRPRKILSEMQKGDYARLMDQLGVRFVFREKK